MPNIGASTPAAQFDTAAVSERNSADASRSQRNSADASRSRRGVEVESEAQRRSYRLAASSDAEAETELAVRVAETEVV